jgi:ribosomal protein S18 acetylase RimI-like enzyme
MATASRRPDVRVREATPLDLAACAEILVRAWSSALPNRPRRVALDDFREQTGGELLLVATLERDPVGFISVWSPVWFVHHLFVDPRHQGRGIGSRLLGHVSTLAGGRSLSLKCQVENRAALRFYERHGFRTTDSRGRDEFGEWVELRAESVQAGAPARGRAKGRGAREPATIADRRAEPGIRGAVRQRGTPERDREP